MRVADPLHDATASVGKQIGLPWGEVAQTLQRLSLPEKATGFGAIRSFVELIHGILFAYIFDRPLYCA